MSKPISLSEERAAACVDEILKPWYNLYAQLVASGDYCEELTFNFDETPLNFGTRFQSATIAQKGKKDHMTIPKRIQNLTLCLTICCNGNSLRTKLIWHGKRIPNEFSTLPSHGIDVFVSQKGYQTRNLFETMMITQLIPEMVQRRKQLKKDTKKILLIIDSHISRISSAFIK